MQHGFKYNSISAITGLIFILLTSPSCDALHTQISGIPDIKIDETVYDFGIAGREQRITHHFTFKNNGTADLQIDDITVPCGCEARLLNDNTIKPGASGTIDVGLTTIKYAGKQQKEIILHTNDPDTPDITLQIMCRVKLWVAVMPEALNFGQVKITGAQKRTFKVLQLEKEPLNIEKIYSEKDYFEINWVPFKDENARGFEVTVAMKPSIPAGMLNEVITVYTNLKKLPRVDVPIFAKKL
jgi:hypothetical protein